MNKKTTNFKKQPTKQLVVALILIVVSAIFFSLSLAVYQASKPVVYNYGIYKLGTPIAAGSATIVINNITYEQGHGTFNSPAGKQYLVADVTFQNNSNKTISILPSIQTYIKDNDGKVYYLTPLGLDEPFRAGDLLPGDKITGQLSYLVPIGKSYTIYIDAIWSGGVVSVKLS